MTRHGTPLADATMAAAQAADAVLLGAVGGPKYDRLDFSVKPERGLLRLRKEMDLYANLRPAQCFDALADFSSLKKDVVAGLDIMIVRELTSGIYFGEPRGIAPKAISGSASTPSAIPRPRSPASPAPPSSLARQRNKVCSMEKANVMESGILWREVVQEVHDRDYPDVALSHMYADAGAMQLVRWPKQFDVIVTDNLFGDLLSDEAAMLTGSLGMLPSASLGAPRWPTAGPRRCTSRFTARPPTSPARARPTPDRLHPLLCHGAALFLRSRRRGRSARGRGGGRARCRRAHPI
jgi:3-isopropylmalate dehydrogenase